MVPFRFGTPEEFASLRALLIEARFTEQAICERFGLKTIHEFCTIWEGRRPAAAITDGTEALIRVFMDEDRLERRLFDSLVAPSLQEALRDFGLVVPDPLDPDRCRGTVLMYPTETLYIISDGNFHPDSAPETPPPDVVYPAITTNTGTFLSCMSTDPCDRFLEVCSGTGIAALWAASRCARHVWAADITERSTQFAEFNRRLNGLGNVSAVRSDLFAAFEGQTFDRICAHPPYVPNAEIKFVFRDGGEDGEQITNRIIEALPRFLAPGGRFDCTTMASDRGDLRYEQRLRAMLGPQESEFDILLLTRMNMPPTEYYFRQALRGASTFQQVGDRAAVFDRLKMKNLVYCSMVIRRRATPRPVFTVRVEAGPRSAREEIAWLMRWKEAEPAEETIRALLDSRPVASMEARMCITHGLHEGKWVPADCTLQTVHPFRVEVKCPTWVAALLARSDGSVTLRDSLKFLQESGALSPDTPPLEFARFVSLLVGAGVIEFDGFRIPGERLPTLRETK